MTTNLIEEYAQLYGKFTYAHPDDPKKYNGLQVGLVATFYIENSWQKRPEISEVMVDFYSEYGEHLKYGRFYNGSMFTIPFNKDIFLKLKEQMPSLDVNDGIELYLGNTEGNQYVNNYQFSIFSLNKWRDDLDFGVSYVKFYLPIQELENQGVERFINRVMTYAGKLQPIHGVVGLGIQQTNDLGAYQHIEYKIAHQFRGLDVSNFDFDLRYKNGFKSINWLTILSSSLIDDKLGGIVSLETNNQDPDIKFLPYDGGLIVQAGALPAFGFVESDPNPIHYVNVNKLLKNARAPEIGSLGLGSIAGEIRFDERTTAEWQARFDNVDVESTLMDQDKQHNDR